MGILDNTAVGFIGVGAMGKSIGKRLQSLGATTYAYVRSPAARYEIARDGISLCKSPADIADKMDSGIIILMLSDSGAVDAVMEGEDSLLSTLSADTLVIDLGNTAVIDSKRYAALAEAKGASWINASAKGDQDAALNGKLEILTGARAEDYSRALPLLNCLGRTVNHVGGIDSKRSQRPNNPH